MFFIILLDDHIWAAVGISVALISSGKQSLLPLEQNCRLEGRSMRNFDGSKALDLHYG
jgi:hypothetical protein